MLRSKKENNLRKSKNSETKYKKTSLKKTEKPEFPELEEIKNGFDIFDSDNKGVISTKDFAKTMQEMNLDEKYPYLYSIFKDANADITYDELIEMLQKNMDEINKKKNLKKLFDFLTEGTNDDKLPWHSFIQMAKELKESATEKELKQLLSQSGCIGDELSFDEFCIVMREGGLDE